MTPADPARAQQIVDAAFADGNYFCGRDIEFTARGKAILVRRIAEALAEEREVWRAVLDIATLRGYHDLSFADPPSYHEPDVGEDLWLCFHCVDRYVERATRFLNDASVAAAIRARGKDKV